MNRFVCLAALVLAALWGGPLPGGDSKQEGSHKDRLLEQFRTDLLHKNYARAQTVLDALLRLEPENYQLHNLRGVSYEKAGRYGEATRWYLKSLELQPTALTVRLNLALHYLRLGKDAEAGREFARLVEREGTATMPPPNPY